MGRLMGSRLLTVGMVIGKYTIIGSDHTKEVHTKYARYRIRCVCNEEKEVSYNCLVGEVNYKGGRNFACSSFCRYGYISLRTDRGYVISKGENIYLNGKISAYKVNIMCECGNVHKVKSSMLLRYMNRPCSYTKRVHNHPAMTGRA